VELTQLWTGLGWPLCRLVGFLSLGLFIALLIETLNWTRAMAVLATPLVRWSRLRDVSGASFSLAFFSGAAANAMLAEQYDAGTLSRRELVLSNLFNSMPTYLLHLPTMFFTMLPFIGKSAVAYLGLTLLAATLRTGFIVLLGRLTLPRLPEGCVTCLLDEKRTGFRSALRKAWGRFRKRIRRLLLYSIPVYVLIYFLNVYGLFDALQRLMAEKSALLGFLPPEAIGIVVFQVIAESSAGLATAGALLQAGNLTGAEVILALLVGNILSTPMRAFRHQLPFYAGIFKPALAGRLILYNQLLRAASLVLVATAFALWGHLLPRAWL